MVLFLVLPSPLPWVGSRKHKKREGATGEDTHTHKEFMARVTSLEDCTAYSRGPATCADWSRHAAWWGLVLNPGRSPRLRECSTDRRVHRVEADFSSEWTPGGKTLSNDAEPTATKVIPHCVAVIINFRAVSVTKTFS